MAIPHALPSQVTDILPTGARLPNQRTTALFKGKDLEVIRLALKAKKSLPPHMVAGEITIHCLEGVMSISVEGAEHVLRSGQLIYLSGNVVHGVTAIEDILALVTIALTK
jgi:quercetin dioxygenase-like cupin family protein